MMNTLFRGTALTLFALAFACFAIPTQAQNQAGLDTAAEAAGDGTSTFSNLLNDLEGLFTSMPEEAEPGLATAGEASLTGGEVSGERLDSLAAGDTALGRPPPTLTPVPANIGRPPVQTGPPAGVGGGRGGRF